MQAQAELLLQHLDGLSTEAEPLAAQISAASESCAASTAVRESALSIQAAVRCCPPFLFVPPFVLFCLVEVNAVRLLCASATGSQTLAVRALALGCIETVGTYNNVGRDELPLGVTGHVIPIAYKPTRVSSSLWGCLSSHLPCSRAENAFANTEAATAVHTPRHAGSNHASHRASPAPIAAPHLQVGRSWPRRPSCPSSRLRPREP